MSKRCLLTALKRLAKGQALAFAMAVSTVGWAEVGYGNDAARLATYRNESGQTSFALSLAPQLPPSMNESSDVVILVDTSASQIGGYREESLAALRSVLAGLSDQDRVKLLAVDLEPVELTDGFVQVGDAAIDQALAALEARTPLGSTDVAGMLGDLSGRFDADASRPRNAIYIGDGVSTASFLDTDEFGALTGRLAGERVAVSSFAVGPERNVALMAALANRTGGNIYLANGDVAGAELGGVGLAKTVRHAVIWPEKVEFPSAMTETFPATLPPLRSDRDTIVVGTLGEAGSVEIGVEATVNGQAVSLSWAVDSEESSEDFAFLPKLIEMARDDQGASLPTIGSEGLEEVRRVIDGGAQGLVALGEQALAAGDIDGARKLAEQALATDPTSAAAATLQGALANAPAGGNGLVLMGQDEEIVGQEPSDRGRFLRQAESQLDLLNQKTKAEIQAALGAA
ncbi:MAG TPA: hypothetical protein PLI18_16335, partial [Pirellulaceae bacterium]|nr:hypothetical protein [Pirellulaceae bacterium]